MVTRPCSECLLPDTSKITSPFTSIKRLINHKFLATNTMRGVYIALLLCAAICIHAHKDVATTKEFNSDRRLQRIVFGSCNKHDRPQPAWANIVDLNPDLFIWLGDTV